MNNTALGCTSVGWILLILGSIISVYVGINYQNSTIGVIGVITSIVFGILLIGIGEIIHLLSKMVNNDEAIKVKISQETEKSKG